MIAMTIDSLKRNFQLLTLTRLHKFILTTQDATMTGDEQLLTYKPAGTCVEIVLNLVDRSCGGGGRLILRQNWF